MGNSCHCGHGCGCNDDKKETADSSKEKVENLKKAIADLGFHVEENDDGEIKISERK
jgi:hypothetical protein